MAKLVECKDCGHQISKKATTCPSCGAPRKRQSSTGSGCLLLIILFVGIGTYLSEQGGGGSRSTSTSSPTPTPVSWKAEDNSIMAYIMMEDFVKRRLKSPSTAEFPGVFDGRQDHVSRLSNQTYRIVSYVDAQNSFGAMLRTNFIGEIQQTGPDIWQLKSLDLLE